MKNLKISTILFFALLFSIEIFAQRGQRHDNHYNHNDRYRNRVSIHVGQAYGYRQSYRPYYRPTPVYRPVIRSVYSNQRSFIPYGPAFGFRIRVLPFGYNRIFVGPVPYYYNDGVYYRDYQNGGYEVVAPPLHASVKKLPSNARVTVIDGQKYYEAGGTFYREEMSSDNRLSYRVVGTDGVLNTGVENPGEDLNAYDDAIPTPGSRYDELPAESRVQVINQKKYFVSPGGIYYKEVIEGDKVRYEATTVD